MNIIVTCRNTTAKASEDLLKKPLMPTQLVNDEAVENQEGTEAAKLSKTELLSEEGHKVVYLQDRDIFEFHFQQDDRHEYCCREEILVNPIQISFVQDPYLKKAVMITLLGAAMVCPVIIIFELCACGSISFFTILALTGFNIGIFGGLCFVFSYFKTTVLNGEVVSENDKKILASLDGDITSEVASLEQIKTYVIQHMGEDKRDKFYEDQAALEQQAQQLCANENMGSANAKCFSNNICSISEYNMLIEQLCVQFQAGQHNIEQSHNLILLLNNLSKFYKEHFAVSYVNAATSNSSVNDLYIQEDGRLHQNISDFLTLVKVRKKPIASKEVLQEKMQYARTALIEELKVFKQAISLSKSLKQKGSLLESIFSN